MKLVRPYIPLKVRVKVAERQLAYHGVILAVNKEPSLAKQLTELLGVLQSILRADKLHLDHDPALALRKFNKHTGKYKPDTNDPEYLKYRATDGHHTKTFIRGEHGQRSDVAQIKRERQFARRWRKKYQNQTSSTVNDYARAMMRFAVSLPWKRKRPAKKKRKIKSQGFTGWKNFRGEPIRVNRER